MHHVYMAENTITRQRFYGTTALGTEHRWQRLLSGVRVGHKEPLVEAIRVHGKRAFRVTLVAFVP